MTDARPKLTAKQASAAALAGELPGAGADLEPFGPVPISTCHYIARRERLSRQVQGRSRLAKAENSAKAVAIVLADSWDELDRAREDVRRKKMTGAERARALRDIALTAQTLARVERELTGEKPSKKTPAKRGDAEPTKRQRTEADAFAREARNRAQTEQPRTPDTATGLEPTPQSTAPRTTDNAQDSATHTRALEPRALASSLT